MINSINPGNCAISINDKLHSIITYTIKQKVKLEYIKDKYEFKNFIVVIFNMIFSSINSLLFSLSASKSYEDSKEDLDKICFYITFICTTFSFLIKILDYSTIVGKYKNYIDECNNIICCYINYNMISTEAEKKENILNKILAGYENIIKYSSELSHKYDAETDANIDEMICDFDDILNINSKTVKKYNVDKRNSLNSVKQRQSFMNKFKIDESYKFNNVKNWDNNIKINIKKDIIKDINQINQNSRISAINEVNESNEKDDKNEIYYNSTKNENNNATNENNDNNDYNNNDNNNNNDDNNNNNNVINDDEKNNLQQL